GEACAAVDIPVIGNGGIVNAEVAKQFLDAGCAGVMIGRGAIGNPFIFSEIKLALETPSSALRAPSPSGGEGERGLPVAKKRLQIYLALIHENVAYYGERIGVNRSRKTAGYWISNFPNAAEVRGQFVRLDTLAEIEKLFASILA
ncbi:MAG: tRNA-dihydrouridine synthase, partial [Elusimicrobiaceae bacterium]|nr:tRNA-dihydrouridine synthase [Elusimicrobiaceae bacterium]